MKLFERSLNGEWRLRPAGGGKTLRGNVPGDVSYDAFLNGEKPDYRAGDNYKLYADLVQSDFEYSRELTVGRELLDCDDVVLQCDGIDTFSEIFVNGVSVGKTDDMFMQYKFSVKAALREGKNEIRILLRSTLKEMEKFENDRYVSIFNEKRIFVRKAQCHFGWDWAPNLPGYGVWQGVSLYGENKYRMRDIAFFTRRDGSVRAEITWSFSDYFDERAKDDEAVLEIFGDESLTLPVLGCKDKLCGKKSVLNFHIPNVRLWWPNGYGKQEFYYARVRLMREGKALDTAVRRFAVREIELDQSAYDARSNLCRLKVNGAPVFSKGSNWVPADCFAGTLDENRYETLLELARRANFNMLRVWGGGYYEKEVFYDKCDEKGILIWQDFMFSCCDIPYDSFEFIEKITEESENVFARLRAHACIALICGGNELKGTLDPTEEPVYGLPFVDYFLRGIAQKWFPDLPYVNQSPFGFTEVANDLQNGDTHTNCYEEAIIGGEMAKYRDVLAKNRAAFFSECAVLGPCRYRSLKKFMPAEKLWPLNDLYTERFVSNPYSPCPLTFAEWELLTARQLFGAVNNAREFCHKGMQAHYEILKSEIEHARAQRFCGGFMNWMYNDIWPTGTWSVVDYYLEPKSAYYAMREAFRPLHAFYTKETGGFRVNVVNDTRREAAGTLTLCGKKLRGEILWSEQKFVRVGAAKTAFFPMLAGRERADYWTAEFAAEGEIIKSVYFPNLWELPFQSDYTYEVAETNGGYFVDIRARAFARAVSLDVAKENARVWYSENFFDLEAGETRRVFLETSETLRAEDIRVSDFTKLPEE